MPKRGKKKIKESGGQLSQRNLIIAGFVVLAIVLVIAMFGFRKEETSVPNSDESEKDAVLPIVQGNEIAADRSLMSVFSGYRKSLAENDLTNFKFYSSQQTIAEFEKELGKDLTQGNFRVITSVLNSVFPPVEDVGVFEQNIEGSSATWKVYDKKKAGREGEVKFVNEVRGWKVLSEHWIDSN